MILKLSNKVTLYFIQFNSFLLHSFLLFKCILFQSIPLWTSKQSVIVGKGIKLTRFCMLWSWKLEYINNMLYFSCFTREFIIESIRFQLNLSTLIIINETARSTFSMKINSIIYINDFIIQWCRIYWLTKKNIINKSLEAHWYCMSFLIRINTQIPLYVCNYQIIHTQKTYKSHLSLYIFNFIYYATTYFNSDMRDKFFLKVSLNKVSFNPACDIFVLFIYFLTN